MLRRLAAALVAGVALVAAGCGRKAAPMPPVVRVAGATRDLAVYQEGEQAVLSFSYPSMTTSGGPLPDLEKVEVWRAHLPPGQEPHGTTPRDRDLAVQLLTNRGERLLLLDRTALDAATRGASLVVRDDLRSWYEANKDDMPLVLWYGVRSVCCGGRRSAFSNIARLEPQLPPPPPEGLTLQPTVDGVCLSWTATPGLGALVERSPDGTEWETLTTKPVMDGDWLDAGAAQERRWSYRLRSVRTLAGGGRVVGAPSPAQEVDYADLYPPEVPRDLVCLPEGQLVRLRWEAVPDATVYRVFRQAGNGPWAHLDDALRGLELEDSAPPAGSLTYGVKAVDAAGNESPAATCTTVAEGLP